ncbi:MAG: nitrogenase iron-molybdenum cofactor biosynthesis protein NifN [Alphaproteobacteria bacterium]|nr:nitrogenase iron-molybdenum cofactor biosynthesis protein NifN [Alphaproteobacteria bacterium]
MAKLIHLQKAAATNPLKMSAPLGGALAFMGVDGCAPLFHGSQGCTAFALVLMVRHFRESIPLQTTAMNEVTTILGGADNLEQALVNLRARVKPKLIGICTTGLTETRGEDFAGDLRLIRRRRPELADTPLVLVSTPDFSGGIEEGWGKAVRAMVRELVEEAPPGGKISRQINVLAPCYLTPGDIEELREMIGAFGLEPILLPDLSGSLDGHVPDTWIATTFGGAPVEAIRRMGRSAVTLVVGEHMRYAAQALTDKTGVPYRYFDRLTGLDATDQWVATLAEISGQPVPARLRRQRSQLVDAMLDGHFFFGGKRIAIAAEPDLLRALGGWFADMGATLAAAVTTGASPALDGLPAEEVVVGDLADLEARSGGCDLLVTHAHGRQASQRTGIPLLRAGFPIFDRLGVAHEVSVGYRGTRDLVFRVANLFMAHEDHAGLSPHTPFGAMPQAPFFNQTKIGGSPRP